jgi:hypothetical protein
MNFHRIAVCTAYPQQRNYKKDFMLVSADLYVTVKWRALQKRHSNPFSLLIIFSTKIILSLALFFWSLEKIMKKRIINILKGLGHEIEFKY